jgi:hypothetical protein
MLARAGRGTPLVSTPTASAHIAVGIGNDIHGRQESVFGKGFGRHGVDIIRASRAFLLTQGRQNHAAAGPLQRGGKSGI